MWEWFLYRRTRWYSRRCRLLKQLSWQSQFKAKFEFENFSIWDNLRVQDFADALVARWRNQKVKFPKQRDTVEQNKVLITPCLYVCSHLISLDSVKYICWRKSGTLDAPQILLWKVLKLTAYIGNGCHVNDEGDCGITWIIDDLCGFGK